MSEKPKLILHVCCAVCGAALADALKDQFELTLFYYNPNIWPKEEYERRLEAVKKLSEIYQLNFEEGEYENELWLERVKGWEDEPEGGRRCPICFEMRLEKTAELAKKQGASYFTTTLAISPFKDEEGINAIASRIAQANDLKFLPLAAIGDKKDLWQKSRLLAKQYQLYHQKYCGCPFSLKTTSKR